MDSSLLNKNKLIHRKHWFRFSDFVLAYLSSRLIHWVLWTSSSRKLCVCLSRLSLYFFFHALIECSTLYTTHQDSFLSFPPSFVFMFFTSLFLYVMLWWWCSLYFSYTDLVSFSMLLEWIGRGLRLPNTFLYCVLIEKYRHYCRSLPAHSFQSPITVFWFIFSYSHSVLIVVVEVSLSFVENRISNPDKQ